MGAGGGGRTQEAGRRRAPGFTLVGVVVAIAILTILIAAVGPSVYAIVQRDKENGADLSGKPVRARDPALPAALRASADVDQGDGRRASPRTLRRLFKEPMCNCDDWHLIIAGTPDASPPGAPPGVFPARAVRGGRPVPGTSRRRPTRDCSPTPPPVGPDGARLPRPAFPRCSARPPTRWSGRSSACARTSTSGAFASGATSTTTTSGEFIAGDADNDIGRRALRIPVLARRTSDGPTTPGPAR